MKTILKMRSRVLLIGIMMLLVSVIPLLQAVSNSEKLEINENVTSMVPDLVYFPISYNFGNVLEGNLYQTTFDIWNGGTGTLTWSLGIVDSWVNPQPVSGTSTGEHETITVRIDTTGLSIGSYLGSISITANDSGGMQFFTVTFTVIDNDPPNIPSQLNGPSSGTIGDALLFTTSTTDPNGDNVMYGFDYNDDDNIDFWSSAYLPSGFPYAINITFNSPGVFPLRVLAKDVFGAVSDFSAAKVVTISGSSNDPPNTPVTPLGPNTGNTGISYTFSTDTIDPDGDKVKYGWDWNGDGTVDEWSGFINSGVSDIRAHTWTISGNYYIKVVAEDEHGAQSSFSSAKTVTITSNQPPNKPSLTGPSSGRTGTSYSYSSTSNDYDEDRIYYWFDWGDTTNTGWVGPFESGQQINEAHIWTAEGTFNVKVKTKDIHGAESVWSSSIPITIPKSKSLTLWQTILEFFPSLSQLLKGVY